MTDKNNRPLWTAAQDYRFTADLTAAQWAWEFLRRNPAYRTEYADFITTWRALEAAYGRPAKRDMQAWKQDPRAWLPAAQCAGSDCRVDGDNVLIECAMGARWGFYKFPPDPRDDDPVGEGRLVWREVKAQVQLPELDETQAAPSPGSLLVRFDLGLPLQDQLLSAKRRLQMEQRRRIRSGLIAAPRIGAHRERLCLALRLLDALAVGAGEVQIQHCLALASTELRVAAVKEARELLQGGYRDLLLLE